ncbi:MAG: Trm112 family protein [Terracidiphilus sp.]|jgi:uncharacterized protein YbaR (Trm112 family)
MPADSVSLPSAFDPSVVGQLACPVCLGELRLEERKLLCAECGRAYPVVDGIPVLIGEKTAILGSERAADPHA